jgi:hypothetical protein
MSGELPFLIREEKMAATPVYGLSRLCRGPKTLK